MSVKAILPVILFAVALPALADDEMKEIAAKVDLSYLTKTWSLECKSQKFDRRLRRGPYTLTLRLEFKNDVPNLKQLREEFTARGEGIPVQGWKPSDSALWFYFFDDENV